MKRFILFLVLLAFLAVTAYGAGSGYVDRTYSGSNRVYTVSLTADASGDVDYSFATRQGIIHKVLTFPVTGASDAWDLTITAGHTFRISDTPTYRTVTSGNILGTTDGQDLTNDTGGTVITLDDPFPMIDETTITVTASGCGAYSQTNVEIWAWDE